MKKKSLKIEKRNKKILSDIIKLEKKRFTLRKFYPTNYIDIGRKHKVNSSTVYDVRDANFKIIREKLKKFSINYQI